VVLSGDVDYRSNEDPAKTAAERDADVYEIKLRRQSARTSLGLGAGAACLAIGIWLVSGSLVWLGGIVATVVLSAAGFRQLAVANQMEARLGLPQKRG
jgi:hypothetical protein